MRFALFFCKEGDGFIPYPILAKVLRSGCKIAFFGGAGVSTESGIPDFKSTDGLYNGLYKGYPPESILHTNFFTDNTEVFYDFYFHKMVNTAARPNMAHLALASLEREGRLTGVVTQNIDGLHQQAGSVNVAELHGNIHHSHCISCGMSHGLVHMLPFSPGVPKCGRCGGNLKPDVVLYGENLAEKTLLKAVKIIGEADALVVGGTSLTVYPAAGLIEYFNGDDLILINKGDTSRDGEADEVIRRPIGEVLSVIFSHE